MKIFFAIILSAALLISCSAEYTTDPFSAFVGEIEADISLTFSGQPSSFTYSGGSVRFTAPDELNGYTLTRQGEQVYFNYGELSVGVSDSAGRVLRLCESVFSPEKVTDITAEHRDGVTVTLVQTPEYVYVFSSEGIPISVSGSFEGEAFEMSFSRFEVRSK